MEMQCEAAGRLLGRRGANIAGGCSLVPCLCKHLRVRVDIVASEGALLVVVTAQEKHMKPSCILQ